MAKTKTVVKRKTKRKVKTKGTTGKRWFYWIADEECSKYFFESESKFLGFLQHNDPIECGAEQLTKKQFEALPDYTG